MTADRGIGGVVRHPGLVPPAGNPHPEALT
jgi:hypothetical protein